MFSCATKIAFEEYYILNSNDGFSYSDKEFTNNFNPSLNNINEFQEKVYFNKVRNNDDLFNTKETVYLKPGLTTQFSGAIDKSNDSILFATIIYKMSSDIYDFENKNYIWFDSSPFSSKKSKFIVISYNLTNKEAVVLNASEYPKKTN